MRAERQAEVAPVRGAVLIQGIRVLQYEEPLSNQGAARQLMSNPVLIEVTRGPLVESFHTGALAVVISYQEQGLKSGRLNRSACDRARCLRWRTHRQHVGFAVTGRGG